MAGMINPVITQYNLHTISCFSSSDSTAVATSPVMTALAEPPPSPGILGLPDVTSRTLTDIPPSVLKHTVLPSYPAHLECSERLDQSGCSDAFLLDSADATAQPQVSVGSDVPLLASNSSPHRTQPASSPRPHLTTVTFPAVCGDPGGFHLNLNVPAGGSHSELHWKEVLVTVVDGQGRILHCESHLSTPSSYTAAISNLQGKLWSDLIPSTDRCQWHAYFQSALHEARSSTPTRLCLLTSPMYPLVLGTNRLFAQTFSLGAVTEARNYDSGSWTTVALNLIASQFPLVVQYHHLINEQPPPTHQLQVSPSVRSDPSIINQVPTISHSPYSGALPMVNPYTEPSVKSPPAVMHLPNYSNAHSPVVPPSAFCKSSSADATGFRCTTASSGSTQVPSSTDSHCFSPPILPVSTVYTASKSSVPRQRYGERVVRLQNLLPSEAIQQIRQIWQQLYSRSPADQPNVRAVFARQVRQVVRQHLGPNALVSDGFAALPMSSETLEWSQEVPPHSSTSAGLLIPFCGGGSTTVLVDDALPPVSAVSPLSRWVPNSDINPPSTSADNLPSSATVIPPAMGTESLLETTASHHNDNTSSCYAAMPRRPGNSQCCMLEWLLSEESDLGLLPASFYDSTTSLPANPLLSSAVRTAIVNTTSNACCQPVMQLSRSSPSVPATLLDRPVCASPPVVTLAKSNSLLVRLLHPSSTGISVRSRPVAVSGSEPSSPCLTSVDSVSRRSSEGGSHQPLVVDAPDAPRTPNTAACNDDSTRCKRRQSGPPTPQLFPAVSRARHVSSQLGRPHHSPITSLTQLLLQEVPSANTSSSSGLDSTVATPHSDEHSVSRPSSTIVATTTQSSLCRLLLDPHLGPQRDHPTSTALMEDSPTPYPPASGVDLNVSSHGIPSNSQDVYAFCEDPKQTTCITSPVVTSSQSEFTPRSLSPKAMAEEVEFLYEIIRRDELMGTRNSLTASPLPKRSRIESPRVTSATEENSPADAQAVARICEQLQEGFSSVNTVTVHEDSQGSTIPLSLDAATTRIASISSGDVPCSVVTWSSPAAQQRQAVKAASSNIAALAAARASLYVAASQRRKLSNPYLVEQRNRLLQHQLLNQVTVYSPNSITSGSSEFVFTAPPPDALVTTPPPPAALMTLDLDQRHQHRRRRPHRSTSPGNLGLQLTATTVVPMTPTASFNSTVANSEYYRQNPENLRRYLREVGPNVQVQLSSYTSAVASSATDSRSSVTSTTLSQPAPHCLPYSRDLFACATKHANHVSEPSQCLGTSNAIFPTRVCQREASLPSIASLPIYTSIVPSTANIQEAYPWSYSAASQPNLSLPRGPSDPHVPLMVQLPEQATPSLVVCHEQTPLRRPLPYLNSLHEQQENSRSSTLELPQQEESLLPDDIIKDVFDLETMVAAKQKQRQLELQQQQQHAPTKCFTAFSQTHCYSTNEESREPYNSGPVTVTLTSSSSPSPCSPRLGPNTQPASITP